MEKNTTVLYSNQPPTNKNKWKKNKVNIYFKNGMYKQGPNAKHQELYSISCDKSEKKEYILKRIYRLSV